MRPTANNERIDWQRENEEKIARFLESGGKIKQLPMGASALSGKGISIRRITTTAEKYPLFENEEII